MAMIEAALVGGALAGTKDAPSAAVEDACAGLLEAIRRRFANDPHARRALEGYEVDPEAWQAQLIEALVASRIDEDAQVVAAAQGVLALTDPAGSDAGKYRLVVREAKGVQIGDHNVQHNTFS